MPPLGRGKVADSHASYLQMAPYGWAAVAAVGAAGAVALAQVQPAVAQIVIAAAAQPPV